MNAHSFYFDTLKLRELNLEETELAFKSGFLTLKGTSALIWEQKVLTLNKIMVKNTEREPSTCLELLGKKLSKI